MKAVPCIFIALCLLICTSGTAPAKETVKIGLITPLTGSLKTLGESVKNGFNIAVGEYGRKGKYNIQVVMADDGNDPAEGVNAAMTLIQRENVAAIVGPLTSKVATPVSEKASQYKVPMITGSATDPRVTISGGKRKPYIFRACYTDPFQGLLAANFALQELKAKTAAVLYDSGSDYSREMGESFRAAFTKGNGAIVAFEAYRKDTVDFSAMIAQAALRKPQVIFLPDYYDKVAVIARQITRKGIKPILLGADGWDSPDLLAWGGNSVVGGYFVNHYSPDRTDEVAESFIRTYKANYGVVPDVFAALAYDATAILLKAIGAARKPQREDIRKAMEATKKHRGATGVITFDANRDAIKPGVIMRVERKGFTYIMPVNP